MLSMRYMHTRQWGLAVCLAALCVPARAERLVVAAFEYPPIYQNEAEKGSAGDLVVAAFKAAGIEAELKFLPVNRMVSMVASGENACGIGGAVLFENPEVAPKVVVGPPVQYVLQTFMYDTRRYPQGIRFSRLADMADYRIGVLNSSGIMHYLQRETSLKIEANRTHEGSARQLQLQRLDVWAVVDLTGLMTMKTLFPQESRFYRTTAPFNRGDVSLVCARARDGQGRYMRDFRSGLDRIKKDGTYMQIMAKYYGGAGRINRDALPDDLK